MYINFELYRIFYQVAKSGSITKAAQELYISQPAVSQSIKQLETQMGGRLFLRTGKGMELTPEGGLIFEYIKQANLLIETAEKKFTQIKELALGEIRIGASDTITKYYLLRYLRQFMNQYPEIKVKITNRTSQQTIDLLKAGKIDIAFINSFACDDSVKLTACRESKPIFVCNDVLFQDIATPLSVEELSAKELIMLEKTSTTRKRIDEFFEEKGINLQPNLELCSYDLIIDMAKAGFGYACLPEETISEELQTGVLYEVPLAFSLPKSEIALATLKDMPLNFSATKFVDMVLKGRNNK